MWIRPRLADVGSNKYVLVESFAVARLFRTPGKAFG